MSKKYNQLNSDQRYDLWKWVEQNAEAVLASTDIRTASTATEVLGFTVTDSNIVAAREKFGIKKNIGRPVSTKMADLERRIERLEQLAGSWGMV